jgi:hypothetical protein
MLLGGSVRIWREGEGGEGEGRSRREMLLERRLVGRREMNEKSRGRDGREGRGSMRGGWWGRREITRNQLGKGWQREEAKGKDELTCLGISGERGRTINK